MVLFKTSKLFPTSNFEKSIYLIWVWLFDSFKFSIEIWELKVLFSVPSLLFDMLLFELVSVEFESELLLFELFSFPFKSDIFSESSNVEFRLL